MPDPAPRKKPTARNTPAKGATTTKTAAATNRDHGIAKGAKQSTSFAQAATVHDRILLWQTQDILVAGDPDVVSVRSLPRSEACRTPARTQSPGLESAADIDREPRSLPRQSSTKWVQKDNKSWVKQRRSVKNRSGRDSPPNKTSDTETQRVSNPPSPYVRTDSQKTRDVHLSRAEREERRRRRRESRARANGGDSLVNDGIRVYNKSESNFASVYDETSEHEELPDEPISAVEQQHQKRRAKESYPQYKSQLSFDHDGSLPDDEDDHVDNHSVTSPVQASKYAQTLGRPPPSADDLDPNKNRKRDLLSKTKKILAGRPEPGPSNRMPSIEAWLEDQPDDQVSAIGTPTQEKSPSTKPSVKTRRRKSHHQDVTIEPTIAEVPDPNQIWDSLGSVPLRESRGASRREQRKELSSETSTPNRRLFSFEINDEVTRPDDDDHLNASPLPSEPPTSQPPVEDISSKAQKKRRPRRSHDAPAATPQREEDKSQSYLTRENSIQPDRDISPRKQAPEQVNEATAPPVANNAVPLREPSQSPALKRKLTTHEDLMSVLSLPNTRRSTRSRRSKRRQNPSPADTLLREAFETMRQEEVKYMRELKTLVDGVTPVLLHSLLSKAGTATTAGLFGNGQANDASFTKPIIDMGVALQRLKNSHKKIPLDDQNPAAAFAWALSAHRAYADYVKAWRLGFQGVVVNLAPLDEAQLKEEEMLARDLDGDATDDSGEKVDVAYLQKRPLVRIKKLSKFLSVLHDACPTDEKAANAVDMFNDLTETAKQKHSDESGRIEDEAAAAIDHTRARDIKTMAPSVSVQIDRSRKVRARDLFDLSLFHSTGQKLDCGIEVILRDDAISNGGGDILICQVQDEGKWLLFQPVQLSNVSARRDQDPCELVLMIRGVAGLGTGWHEILALRSEDPQAAMEWQQMLGSNPLPPRLLHDPSWRTPDPQVVPPTYATPPVEPATMMRMQLNAAALANLPSDIDVPIGEPSVVFTRKEQTGTQTTPHLIQESQKPSKLSMGGGLQQKSLPERYQFASSLPQGPPSGAQRSVDTFARPMVSTQSWNYSNPTVLSDHSTFSSSAIPENQGRGQFATDRDAPSAAPAYSPQKFNVVEPLIPITPERLPEPSHQRHEPTQETSAVTEDLLQAIENEQQSWISGASPTPEPIVPQVERHQTPKTSHSPAPSAYKQREPPNAERQEKQSRRKSFASIPLTDAIKDQWAALSGIHKKAKASMDKTRQGRDKTSPYVTERSVRSPGRPDPWTSETLQDPNDLNMDPPPPPIHRAPRSAPSSPRSAPVPPHTPIYHQPLPTQSPKPMMKEDRAVSATSSSESDSDETDATSEMSDDDAYSELKDQATPLVHVGLGNRMSAHSPARPLPSVPSSGTRTLDPSDSASQGPYRRAPPASSFPASEKRRSIAMVCSWSDKGAWEPVRDEECSIVISPGLVQAFAMSAAHSQPLGLADWEDENLQEEADQQPLVEFELTPIVPLRKGTALDITIRSPPTNNSMVRTTNNIMFRSRNADECEKLYRYMNWSRCNNPTYAQLARARAHEQSVTFATVVPQTKSRSWFSFGSKDKGGYRANSRPPTSIADSAASGSSATSAFSALKRFGMNSPFSLKRSSVMRRSGFMSGPDSLYSSSHGGSGSGSSTPAPASQAGFIPGPDGPNVPTTSAEAANGGGMVNNMKIRFFLRQGQKWEALGQCLLTVLPAETGPSTAMSRPGSSGASTPATHAYPPTAGGSKPRAQHYRLPSSGHTPHRIHGDGREKRVLITGLKRKDLVLLDETLGESCFEKVMQTGVAINVWKEDEHVQDYGGVMTGRSRTYMIQFRTSTEAAWVFNLCGTYRYGAA